MPIYCSATGTSCLLHWLQIVSTVIVVNVEFGDWDGPTISYFPNVGQEVTHLYFHIDQSLHTVSLWGREETFVKVAFFSQQQTQAIYVCVCVWVSSESQLCHMSPANILRSWRKTASVLKEKEGLNFSTKP